MNWHPLYSVSFVLIALFGVLISWDVLTSLLYAVRNRDVASVESLLEEQVSPPKIRDATAGGTRTSELRKRHHGEVSVTRRTFGGSQLNRQSPTRRPRIGR